MYANSEFEQKSDLIDSELEKQVSEIFQKLENPVTICAVVDIRKDASLQLAAFLNHMASLSPQLSCEFYVPGENSELEAMAQNQLLPFVSVRKGETLMPVSFHGIPGGKEINTFVLALYNTAGPGQKLTFFQKKRIQKLQKKVHLNVYVTLSCHYCAQLAAAGQQLAILNPNVSCSVIDAGLYPEVVASEKIERVPLLVIDKDHRYQGAKTIDELCGLIESL